MLKLFITHYNPDNNIEPGSKFTSASWMNPIFDELSQLFQITFSPDEADIILQTTFTDFTWEQLYPTRSQINIPTIENIYNRHKDSKIYIFYIWDCYSWALNFNSVGIKCNGSFDWNRLQQILKFCDIVLVPNVGTQTTLASNLSVPSQVLLPWAPFFEYYNIVDKRYVAFATTTYATDPTSSWGIKACKELSIPYISTADYPKFFVDNNNYKKLVGECSFLVNTYFEASTGGLSLLEGYNLGKPILISNSTLNGANDIFGDLAYTYEYGSFTELKIEIQRLWGLARVEDREVCQKHCQKFTAAAMAKRLQSKIIERTTLKKEDGVVYE